MKKLLKGLAGLIILIALFMGVVYAITSRRVQQTFQVKETPVPKYTAAEDIKEGKRLFWSRGCADCHGEKHEGKTFLDDPAIGKYTGSNLTTGKGGILASRTDIDLERAIRHGVGPQGRALIVMPAIDYQSMSNQDVGRIIAYIRSVPPVDNVPAERKIGPLGRFLYLIGKIPIFISAEKIDHNATPVNEVTPALTPEYGKYVAQTCTGCHNHQFTGGPIQGAPPEWPPASNITAAGLKGYNEAQFMTAIRTGKRPNGSDINPIMPWRNLSQMTDTELKALWMYLSKQ